ncbi:hypothetical protein NBZ79_09405 [Sneathiella marina]|uniref:Uncharacterized protein n=1 Tax=Sneathiella marina TaxID=2950108 RepID=A0ABY4WEW6_9PROT|nr:hypothetical protein [Sneathiella marina]USG63191.1 hypothetical protein NBZ79_09405 [Sneathiella marina]
MGQDTVEALKTGIFVPVLLFENKSLFSVLQVTINAGSRQVMGDKQPVFSARCCK